MRAKVVIIEEDREFKRSLKDAVNGSGEFRFVGDFTAIEHALLRVSVVEPDLIMAGIQPDASSDLQSLLGLRTRLPTLKVVIVAGNVDAEFARDAFRQGANGYLMKSCGPVQLVQAMRLALAGQVLLSQTLVETMTRAPLRFTVSSAALSVLTPREREIMELLDEGKFYKEIAESLKICSGTVAQHVHHIYEKLGAGNKVEALNKVYPFRAQRSVGAHTERNSLAH